MPSDSPSGVRILVVDDNEDMRSSMKLLLERAGFSVDVAPDGARALEMQRKRPAQVLITDLLMPEKDGIETIGQFSHEFPRVRIIAMSGGGVRVRGERYLDTAAIAGAHAVLRKPFDSALLLSTLSDLVSRSG